LPEHYIHGTVLMAHEISLFEIPNRRLLTDDAKHKAGKRTDIGVAKVSRTIFGATRVRVIRKQDKVRRTGLLATLIVTAMASAGWQWWAALKQADKLASQPLPLSARMQVSVPDFQPEYPLTPAATISLKNDPGISAKIAARNSEVSQKPMVSPNPAIGQKNVQTKPADLKPSPQIDAKPVKAVPIASKPQAKSLAESNSPTKKQVGVQQPAKLSVPIQPVVQTIAATPVARPIVQPDDQPDLHQDVQPAANNPAPVVSAPQPAAKDIAVVEPATSGNQPSAAVSVQSPVNPQH
jgi:hypothetical protein